MEAGAAGRRDPRGGGRPVAVVGPRAETREFARLSDAERPPEGLLLNGCAAFGILASGSRLRLFEREADLRAESDATVARTWELGGSDLGVSHADVAVDALPGHYGSCVRHPLVELG